MKKLAATIGRLTTLLLALLWLTISQLQAQPAAPPVYALREVQQLFRAPEPPGGLVPYRKGPLWGYADTTGRLRILPGLTQELPLLIGGWAKVATSDSTYLVINARGEFLRVSARQVLVPAESNSLRVRPVAENAGQLYVRALPQEFWKDETEPRSWCNDEGRADPYGQRYRRPDWQLDWQPPAAYPDAWDAERGLFIASCSSPASSDSSAAGVDKRYALVDGQGRPRTGFRYDWLDSGPGNRLLFQRAGRVGYLDWQGREVIPPRYTDWYVYAVRELAPMPDGRFVGGVARVLDDSLRQGVIDTTGREIVPLRHWLTLEGPDSAGVTLLRYRTPAGDTVAEFVGPDGRLAYHFRGQDAAPFWRDRAVVRRGGKAGLLDRRGRLVAPLRYDDLYYAHQYQGWPVQSPGITRSPELCFFESAGSSPQHLDTHLLQAARRGKLGFVDRRTGRERVHPRYDVVLNSFRNGLAGVLRDTQAYIIDSRGRELLAAQRNSHYPDWQWGEGRHLYLLLSPNIVHRLSQGQPWVTADTAWLVADRRGRIVVPPQPQRYWPRFVTSRGVAVVETPRGWGALGPGGRPALPLGRYFHIKECGALLLALRREADSSSTADLYTADGRLLRELPRVQSCYFYRLHKLLLVSQQPAASPRSTLLLDQAGRTQAVLPYENYGIPNEPPVAAPLPQRRYLLRLEDEANAAGTGRLPNGRQGGYFSVTGRAFWED